MSNTLEILKAARELISAPERWTRDQFSRNEAGFAIDPESEKACCFCAVGALIKVSDNDIFLRHQAKDFLAEHLPVGYASIPAFNDSHTHPEVVALFDAAIASLSTPVEQEKRS